MSSPPSLRRAKTTIKDLRAQYALRGVAPDPPLNNAFLSTLKNATEPLGIWRGLDFLDGQQRSLPLSRINQDWRTPSHPPPAQLPDFFAMERAARALHDLRMHEQARAAASPQGFTAAVENQQPHQQMRPQRIMLSMPAPPRGCIWAVYPCHHVVLQPGFPRVAGGMWVPMGLEMFD